MKLNEIFALVKLQKPTLSPTSRRLASSHDIYALRLAARKASPRPVFDYVDGGADDEVSMAANEQAFTRRRFIPFALTGVAKVDTTTTIFGQNLALPLVLAPTGLTQMMHSAGEKSVAKVAKKHGLPYTLSTLGTTSIAELAAGEHGDLWFQLYVGKDRERSLELVDEAAAHGYEVLVIAVDTPVSGRRLRDMRNGLTLPPALNFRSLAGIAIRPGYWLRMLTSPGMSFENLKTKGSTVRELKGAAAWFDPDISWADIEVIRKRWKGKLILKGPLGVADARRAVDLGVDGIQLSNHGGRQLDRTVAPLDLVAAVRAEIGPKVTLIVDSGIRSGADIAMAVALGADAAAIGRAYLFGLMAGGEPGVDHALTILSTEFKRTMQLLGVTRVATLRSEGPNLLES
jgi:L-lactate dehydrogenase (cytochrome)